MALRAGYRTILVVDIERYGDPVRDDQIRRRLRNSLFQALGTALDEAGVTPPEFLSDLGDGWMLLLGGDAAVSVLHAVTGSLPQTLLGQGLGSDPAEELRVRAVVHAGQVPFDEQDHPYGRTVTRAFRMLDADALKLCLRRTSGALVVGVSDYLYNEVVRLGHTNLEQSRFEPVGVHVKEEHGTLWVYAPDDPGVAERAGVLISDLEGGVPRVLVAHAAGDEPPAAELADRLKQAGYEIAHQGPLLTGETGETLVDEAVPVLVAGGPVVVCGTATAVGTGWAHRLGRVLERYPEVPLYPVRMEPDAACELLDWEAEIAEWSQDQDRAVGELCEALAADYVTGAPARSGAASGRELVPATRVMDPRASPGVPGVEGERAAAPALPLGRRRVSVGQVRRAAALAALVAVAVLGWVLWAAERGEERRSLASWYDLSGVSVGIGSKEFAGQRLLGQIAVQTLEAAGANAIDQTALGPTGRVRGALEAGAIDGYFEYTGTGWIDILGNDAPVEGATEQFDAVRAADAANGITWFALAPASDTYALAAGEAASGTHDVRTVSEYAEIAKQNAVEATLCVSSEFADRDDGLPGLARHYGFDLGGVQVIRLNPDAIYARVADGETCQFAAVFSLAGQMDSERLTVLEDDKGFFPSYNIAMVMRTETYEAHADAYDKLFGEIAERLTDERMRELNARVAIDGEDHATVAADFLRSEGII